MLAHFGTGWHHVTESITDGSGVKRLRTLNETAA